MAASNKQQKNGRDHELVSEILKSEDSSSISETKLQTSERVIARVTDGIYRQPGSALRELVSNAYDADATRVVIKTDAPRFGRISVEDDGHGMTPEALVHLLHHIGGSAKRQQEGAHLGVTSNEDPSLSPNGRKLIGKIGIGLFSVSQLTHTFQIITKTKGDPFRTVATVALRQHSDDSQKEASDSENLFQSGKVKIWREKATDKENHGTTIVLTYIRRQAQDTLRSKEIWAIVDHNESASEDLEKQAIDPPVYHVGRVDSSGDSLVGDKGNFSNLPWEDEDSPKEAFEKLVGSVWDEIRKGGKPNVKLENLFDFYFRMVWNLSLAIPLPYISGHPFDLHLDDWADGFLLSNKPKGRAELLKKSKKSVRDELGLEVSSAPIGDFQVYFDNLLLSRPILFKGLPTSGNAIKKSLMFFGKCREEFPNTPIELSGGTLDFEAYLFWNPKIAPTEHQGALIRVHGSSGTLFDSTFLRYQVSEQTRLRQITCEIYIREGLDSALNIDRESINHAHPHFVYLTHWLHSALRQLASSQKRLSADLLKDTRQKKKQGAIEKIEGIASSTWKKETDDSASEPPQVVITDNSETSLPFENSYVLPRESVITPEFDVKRKTPKAKTAQELTEKKLAAIIQILASYGLYDQLPDSKQKEMAKAIFEVISTSDLDA